MSEKLLKNQIILWPALAEYYVHRWFLPASLKAGTNDRKITKTNTDCNYRHNLEPRALRISMPVGASSLISCFSHLVLYYSDIFNFYLLPETLRDFYFFLFAKLPGNQHQSSQILCPHLTILSLTSSVCAVYLYISFSHIFPSLLSSTQHNAF